MLPFEPFPKIPRLKRNCTITEKIDGTNAQIHIRPKEINGFEFGVDTQVEHEGESFLIRAGSRNRWIKVGDDNYGFASWVYQNAWELAKLGAGQHFGEWYGSGIQRNYGLTEKRFALFNVHRWGHPLNTSRPACCGVVPVLYQGEFTDGAVDAAVDDLRVRGSSAAPGFMLPEGVVVYHHASKSMFKRTLEKDDAAKGSHAAEADLITPPLGQH